MTFVSNAQNFEDVMLWRALKDVQNGFYIDIGAQDPVVDSISYGLYNQGWRGVHVEPSPQYAEKLRLARPDEVVEELLIGDEPSTKDFYLIADTGLSTGDPLIAQSHDNKGFSIEKSTVNTMSLDSLLEKYKEKDIHWLKIDVEGLEKSVVDSWKRSEVRPWILIIESTVPMTQEQSHHEWEGSIVEKGYSFVYFDGLNRFYLDISHNNLKTRFQSPPNVFDNFALGGFASNAMCEVLLKKNSELVAQLEASELEFKKTHEQDKNVQLFISKKAEALEKKISSLNKELLDSGKSNKALEDAMICLAVEKTNISRQLDNTHSALHNIVSSRFWKLSYPIRYIIAKWPSDKISRLHPKRVFASARYRSKSLALRAMLLIGKYPKIKSISKKALEAVGVYEWLRNRYHAHQSRSVQRDLVPLEISGMSQRASNIYADLLRRKKYSEL